jgi:hypothetical protein
MPGGLIRARQSRELGVEPYTEGVQFLMSEAMRGPVPDVA